MTMTTQERLAMLNRVSKELEALKNEPDVKTYSMVAHYVDQAMVAIEHAADVIKKQLHGVK